MSAHECSGTRRAIERAFVSSDARALGRQRASAADCAACEAFYLSLMQAEAMLAAPTPLAAPLPLGPLELALLRERALADDTAVSAPSAATAVSAPSAGTAADARGRRASWRRLVPALSAALAACLVVVVAGVLLSRGGGLTRAPHGSAIGGGGTGVAGGSGAFAVRGSGATGDASLPRAGVRLLCMSSTRDARLSVRSLGASAGASRCARRDRLGFSAFNGASRPQHFAIFVVGARGRVLDADASGGAEALPPRSAEQALDVGVRLDALSAGATRVVVLFSEQPITRALRQTVAAALRDARPLDDLTPSGSSIFRAVFIISE